MDNLAFVNVAVFLLAVAQAMTILLTIRRERDVTELGKLVDELRLRNAELMARFAGRNAAQIRQTKSERVSEQAIAPRDLSATLGPGATKDDLGHATKPFKWFKDYPSEPREVVATREVGANFSGLPTTAQKGLPESEQSPTTEDEAARAMKVLNWQREILTGLRAGLNGEATQSETAITPKDLPGTAPEIEQPATNAAIRLNEETDRVRGGTVKKTG